MCSENKQRHDPRTGVMPKVEATFGLHGAPDSPAGAPVPAVIWRAMSDGMEAQSITVADAFALADERLPLILRAARAALRAALSPSGGEEKPE